jgi:hypothetical protein
MVVFVHLVALFFKFDSKIEKKEFKVAQKSVFQRQVHFKIRI